jgi:DNA-binding MarR family transcriptional regulator
MPLPEPVRRTEIEQTWTDLVQVCAALSWRIDLELQRAHGLSLSAFFVLSQATQGPRKMSDLADMTGLSASGITRLARRLIADGLLTQHRDERDRRLLYAAATPAGRRRHAAAHELYLQLLQELLAAHADADELAVIDRVLTRIRRTHQKT